MKEAALGERGVVNWASREVFVGEASAGDERPKVFPQEIMDLDQAPLKYTRQVHVRISLASATRDDLDRLLVLATANRGKCPLYLCFKGPAGEYAYIEAHEHFSVRPSRELERAIESAFGPGSYYASVDSTLPERERKRWERRSDSYNGEG